MGSQGNGIGCNGHAKGFHGKDSEGSGVGCNSHAKTMPRQCNAKEMRRHANGLHGNAEVCHGHTMPCSGPAMPRISKNIFPKVFQEKKQMILGCDVWFAPPPPFPKNVFPKVFERKKNKMIFGFDVWLAWWVIKSRGRR
jgi:hypothetical protein